MRIVPSLLKPEGESPAGVATRKDQEEDAYQLWKADPDSEGVLRKLLAGHASAVMFKVLRRRDDDLIVEAVDKVMMNLPEFRENSLFTTWAHKIILSVMYDQRRIDRKRKDVSMDVPGFDVPGEGSADAIDLALTVKKTLSEDDFKLFEQIVVWGKTEAEAGEALGMRQSSVHFVWNRVKGTLAHVFAKQLPNRRGPRVYYS